MPIKKTLTLWEKLNNQSLISKILLVTGVVVGLIILLSLSSLVSGWLNVKTTQRTEDFAKSSLRYDAAPEMAADSSGSFSNLREIEIQEGNLEIKSKQAEVEEAEIRALTEEFAGYIESSRRSETPTHLRLFLTSRIPAEDFTVFFNYLKENYQVDNYHLNNYRLNIERATDELTILEQAFEDYLAIRSDIQAMPAGEEKIELLMKLTDTELELARRQQNYLREVSEAQRRGNLATVSVRLEEKLSPDLWPDNIGANFWADLAEAIENIINRLTQTFTGSLILLIAVIQYLIYALIILIPITYLAKVIWRQRKWWFKN